MLLNRLQIHNISSIADATIDFTQPPLAGAPIFLICGDTGSGKTTILDAICLALYEQTPRMASSPKEDIAAGTKSFANDNSNLLRRGTGEGFASLIFTANDGREYEAKWSIKRARNKPSGRLQNSERSLRELNGEFMEINKKNISKIIPQLTGFDYEQFCRTVMLAQGEFTKFMKSDRKEKSEILEKLTGTDIYSRIGQEIARHYSEKKIILEALDTTLKAMTLLPEEDRAQRRQTIERTTIELQQLSLRKDQLSKALQWLTRNAEIASQTTKAEEMLRITEGEMHSEKCASSRKLAQDYRTTVPIREKLLKKEALEKLTPGKLLTHDALVEKQKDAALKLEKASEETAKASDTSKRIANQIESLDPIETNRKINELAKTDRLLGIVLNGMAELNGISQRLADDTQKLEEAKKQAEIHAADVSKLKVSAQVHKLELDKASLMVEKLQLSTSKAAKELRATLTKGDMCPVCGHMVESAVADTVLQSVLDPLLREQAEAQRLLVETEAQRLAAEKLLLRSNQEIKTLSERIERLKRDAGVAQKNCRESIAAAGMTECDIDSLREEAEAKRADIASRLEGLLEVQKRIENLRSDSDKAVKSLDAYMRRLDSAKEQVAGAERAMAEWKVDKQHHDDAIRELEQQLAAFYSENPEMDASFLRSLSMRKESEIAEIEQHLKKLEDELQKGKGALGKLREQAASHQNLKPEIMEEDTIGTLSPAIAAIDEQTAVLNIQIGQLREQLHKDDEQRLRYASELENRNKAAEKVDEWKALYDMLGDNEGAKFRSVAQSFILRTMLESANRYLSCFSDRYTLTCNPGSLAILVNDTHRPGAPQPVGILSGGESFMASLSLALALSHLRGGSDNDVDILFIDEGFGTLSPEYLGNVMDTLEHLHQLGGRKVGLISHVPEMKERIPVHLVVERESPAQSRVRLESV